MTPFLAAAAHSPFAPGAIFFIWLVGVGLTIPALSVAAVACRKYPERAAFALKSFRIAAILAMLDAASLITAFLSMLMDREAWAQVREQGGDFGFWMFLFAVTSVLWGILLLIRKKLITPPASKST